MWWKHPHHVHDVAAADRNGHHHGVNREQRPRYVHISFANETRRDAPHDGQDKRGSDGAEGEQTRQAVRVKAAVAEQPVRVIELHVGDVVVAVPEVTACVLPVQARSKHVTEYGCHVSVWEGVVFDQQHVARTTKGDGRAQTVHVVVLLLLQRLVRWRLGETGAGAVACERSHNVR